LSEGARSEHIRKDRQGRATKQGQNSDAFLQTLDRSAIFIVYSFILLITLIVTLGACILASAYHGSLNFSIESLRNPFTDNASSASQVKYSNNLHLDKFLGIDSDSLGIINQNKASKAA
jgi:hypothetical protein